MEYYDILSNIIKHLFNKDIISLSMSNKTYRKLLDDDIYGIKIDNLPLFVFDKIASKNKEKYFEYVKKLNPIIQYPSETFNLKTYKHKIVKRSDTAYKCLSPLIYNSNTLEYKIDETHTINEFFLKMEDKTINFDIDCIDSITFKCKYGKKIPKAYFTNDLLKMINKQCYSNGNNVNTVIIPFVNFIKSTALNVMVILKNDYMFKHNIEMYYSTDFYENRIHTYLAYGADYRYDVKKTIRLYSKDIASIYFKGYNGENIESTSNFFESLKIEFLKVPYEVTIGRKYDTDTNVDKYDRLAVYHVSHKNIKKNAFGDIYVIDLKYFDTFFTCNAYILVTFCDVICDVKTIDVKYIEIKKQSK